MSDEITADNSSVEIDAAAMLGALHEVYGQQIRELTSRLAVTQALLAQERESRP